MANEYTKDFNAMLHDSKDMPKFQTITDSLVTAELSNWNGKAIKIPWTEVSTCDRDDIRGVGVYFLICQEDDGTDSVYIGEAENVLDRLAQHLRDFREGKVLLEYCCNLRRQRSKQGINPLS